MLSRVGDCVAAKVARGYPPEKVLAVRMEMFDFKDRRSEVLRTLGAALLSASDGFQEVWGIWRADVYRVGRWKAPEGVRHRDLDWTR